MNSMLYRLPTVDDTMLVMSLSVYEPPREPNGSVYRATAVAHFYRVDPAVYARDWRFAIAHGKFVMDTRHYMFYPMSQRVCLRFLYLQAWCDGLAHIIEHLPYDGTVEIAPNTLARIGSLAAEAAVSELQFSGEIIG